MSRRPIEATRREFVRLGALALGTGAATRLGAQSAPQFVPKVNDAINVHPLRRFGPDPNPDNPVIFPELVALQLRLVYELGFDGIRMTAPLLGRGDFMAALTYARAARALGIDAVVLVSDFEGLFLASALADAQKRVTVLRLYQDLFSPFIPAAGPRPTPGRIAFQILNEPAHFLGIPPDFYVRRILTPCFEFLRARNPEGLVVGAAEVGNLDGPERMRLMLEAGLEQSCDRVAYHVYSRRVIPLLRNQVRLLAWVTESGAAFPVNHLPWVREVFPEIRSTLKEVSRIFYYDLFDPDAEKHRAFNIVPRGSAFEALIESPELVAHWSAHVAAASLGAALIRFEEIVPDISAFLPSRADLRAYDDALRLLK